VEVLEFPGDAIRPPSSVRDTGSSDDVVENDDDDNHVRLSVAGVEVASREGQYESDIPCIVSISTNTPDICTCDHMATPPVDGRSNSIVRNRFDNETKMAPLVVVVVGVVVGVGVEPWSWIWTTHPRSHLWIDPSTRFKEHKSDNSHSW
jgi:hypothetical protein